jgi:hypothetical protein
MRAIERAELIAELERRADNEEGYFNSLPPNERAGLSARYIWDGVLLLRRAIEALGGDQ